MAFLVVGATMSPSNRNWLEPLLVVRILSVMSTASGLSVRISGPLPSSMRGLAWERPSSSSSSRVREGLCSIFSVWRGETGWLLGSDSGDTLDGFLVLEMLWRVLVCDSVWSVLGFLYSPPQVCLLEDSGLGSMLLVLNKPLKGGLHHHTYSFNMDLIHTGPFTPGHAYSTNRSHTNVMTVDSTTMMCWGTCQIEQATG